MELDFVTDAELADALLSFVKLTDFTDSNQLLSESGYQKLPGGLILQWGKAILTSSESITVILPVAFPADCLIAVASANNDNSSVAVTAKSAASIRLNGMVHSASSNVNSSAGSMFFYFAIGL